MAQAKGKKLADQPSQNAAEESFIERVGSSAAGLLRSTVLQPSADQATSSLASSSLANDKSQSSSGQTGSAHTNDACKSNNLAEIQQPGSSSFSNSSGESFRSAQYRFGDVKPSTEAEFEAFSQMSQVGQAHRENTTESKRGALDQSTHQTAVEIILSQSVNLRSYTTGMDECKLADRDGEAVVVLLSNPDWDLEETASDVALSEELEDSRNLFEIPPEIKEALHRIKSNLPPPPTFKSASPMNPLNLNPDFTSGHENPARDSMKIRSTTSANWNDDYAYMTAKEPIGIQELEPWLDVLTNYQDAVWGDVAPLVKEIREEVKIAKENNVNLIDSIAVRRLEMILGHLKTPVTSATQYL
ncbi:hypothetical protein MMC14_004033 [Varicellaria rhodocarpa]|nr:hypothetical protein [Varicellaria rhodocarpa]